MITTCYSHRVFIFVALLCVLFCPRIFAQEIIVKNFELNLRDASASTKPRFDDNGAYCALLKVASTNKDLVFSGNVVGTVENKINEYWVYVKNGGKSLKITTPGSNTLDLNFVDYGIEELKSKTTYYVTLVTNTSQSKTEEKKNQLSFLECKLAVQSGDDSRLLDLGKCYLYGLETDENPSEAARCFEKAANKGYLEAIHLVGDSYFYGLGNPKNYEIAVEYYTKSANKGYAPSLNSLGLCYQQGKGVKQNEKKAKYYFKKAVEKGYSKTLNNR